MSPLRRVVRAARKDHECDADPCIAPTRRIERGTPYVRLSMPPNRGPNYGDGFWMLALHLGCAAAKGW